MNLGIDIGNVLISPERIGAADTTFLGATVEEAIKTPPYPDMFEVVPALVEHFSGRVWLVSKAYPRMQEKTRRWLEHHQFFGRTGMPPENLRFCLERHQKADHCRELAITHFIDDRSDVLGHLKGIVNHRYLFGPQRAGATHDAALILVDTWLDVREKLLAGRVG